MTRKGVWRAVLLLTPVALGMVGFAVLDGRPLLDSLFTCVQLYTLGYGDTPPNLLVELARWLAPLATAGGVFLAVGALRQKLANALRYLRGDSVAVYGPQEERAVFLEQLGKRGVEGQDKLVLARRYILVGSEEESFLFYRTHRKALGDKDVFLKCSSIPPQSAAGARLKLFSPEENAARLFWKGRGMYELSKAHGHKVTIVMLGFGRLGEELLTRGLQNNLFDPGQRFTYHIFGDGGAFSATCLDGVEDSVEFHSEPWYTRLELVEEASLVLALPQPGQLALTQEVLCRTSRKELDVFAPVSFPLELLGEKEQERLRLFYWEKEACGLELVFGDVLLERAKAINLRYSHIYQKVPETAEEKERQWLALDGFTRYSNISAADYHEIRLEMLAAMGVAPEGGALTPELLELFSELEHMRWCRYHLLNHWRFGKPEGTGRKDPVKRIHADLVPYGTLTEEEKEKDRENIRVLLSV